MNKTVYINAKFSSLKDLTIWRLFYSVPLYIYCLIAYFIPSFDEHVGKIIIGGITLAIVWAIYTVKTLAKLRKKDKYVSLTLTQNTLNINDGRKFKISLSEIKYIQWQYHLGTRNERISEEKQFDKQIEKLINRNLTIYPATEQVTIQTTSTYFQIEQISTQNIVYPNLANADAEPRKELAHLQMDLFEALITTLEKGTDQILRTNRHTGSKMIFIPTIGRRHGIDYIDMNIISLMAFIGTPFIIGLIILLSSLF